MEKETVKDPLGQAEGKVVMRFRDLYGKLPSEEGMDWLVTWMAGDEEYARELLEFGDDVELSPFEDIGMCDWLAGQMLHLGKTSTWSKALERSGLQPIVTAIRKLGEGDTTLSVWAYVCDWLTQNELITLNDFARCYAVAFGKDDWLGEREGKNGRMLKNIEDHTKSFCYHPGQKKGKENAQARQREFLSLPEIQEWLGCKGGGKGR